MKLLCPSAHSSESCTGATSEDVARRASIFVLPRRNFEEQQQSGTCAHRPPNQHVDYVTPSAHINQTIARDRCTFGAPNFSTWLNAATGLRKPISPRRIFLERGAGMQEIRNRTLSNPRRHDPSFDVLGVEWHGMKLRLSGDSVGHVMLQGHTGDA